MGPDFAYTDALNSLMEEASRRSIEDGTDYQKQPLRPSSAGKCERELAMELFEFRGHARYPKEVLSPETQRIFSLGHAVESAFIRDLRTHFKDILQIRYTQQTLSYEFFESAVDAKYNLWIEGNTDLVLWSEEFKCVADVKSKKEKFSNYRESDWDETSEKWLSLPSVKALGKTGFYVEDPVAFLDQVNDPFLAMNVLQLNLYACSTFLKERGIDHASLFYYSKNTCRLKELRFKPSEDLKDYVLRKFKNAFDAVDKGDPLLAAKEFNLGSMKCSFCRFNHICWADEDPKKAWFKTLPPKRWSRDSDLIEDSEGNNIGQDLEALYAEYKAATELELRKEVVEQRLCDLLTDAEVKKVRFSDGNIFEVKLLKSPFEHLELRRSKN